VGGGAMKWQVGIYDATNSTRQRRDMLAEMCRGHCKLVFLETIANDPKLIQVRFHPFHPSALLLARTRARAHTQPSMRSVWE